MKISVFTSNQPRHLALLEALADVADEVAAVVECTTIFPGARADFFARSAIMQRYFAEVMRAEARLFGRPRPLPANVRALVVKMGDLSDLSPGDLAPLLDADYFVVFGASWIKGALCERLIAGRAANIHMGVSPYYRGSSCNFWALADGRADLVGATVHLLSEGLDSGDILFHAFPAPGPHDPFDLGMAAVRAAQHGLIARIAGGDLFAGAPATQDRDLQIRYSRNADFTDAVAGDYLDHLPTPAAIARSTAARPASFGERAVVI